MVAYSKMDQRHDNMLLVPDNCVKLEHVVKQEEREYEEEFMESKFDIESLKSKVPLQLNTEYILPKPEEGDQSCCDYNDSHSSSWTLQWGAEGSIKQEVNEDEDELMEDKVKLEPLEQDDEYGSQTECIDVKSEGDKNSETIHRSSLMHGTISGTHKLIQKNPSQHMYKCDQCSYENTCKYKVKNHQLRHKDPSEVQMYKCDECSYESKYKSSLTKHQLMHKDPSEVRKYKCDECSYESKYRSGLTVHQLMHKDPSEVRKYKCDECSFVTKYKCGLTKHQLTHKDSSEVQLYKCDECSYETKYRYALTKHQSRHKDPSRMQLNKCSECSYETRHKTSWTKHQITHKHPSQLQMYKCDKCSYESKFRTRVQKHQSTHKDPSQEQMYKCDKCSYESKFRTRVKKHQSTHKDPSQDQMYNCDVESTNNTVFVVDINSLLLMGVETRESLSNETLYAGIEQQ